MKTFKKQHYHNSIIASTFIGLLVIRFWRFFVDAFGKSIVDCEMIPKSTNLYSQGRFVFRFYTNLKYFKRKLFTGCKYIAIGFLVGGKN